MKCYPNFGPVISTTCRLVVPSGGRLLNMHTVNVQLPFKNRQKPRSKQIIYMQPQMDNNRILEMIGRLPVIDSDLGQNI